MNNYFVLLPEIVFTALFLIYFISGLLIKRRHVNGIFVLIISAITAFTLFSSYGKAFNDMFVADSFSQPLKLVFLLTLFLCTLISLKYERIKDELFYEYTVLMMMSTLAMMLVVSSTDLIPLFLSIELMSLGVYLLAGLEKNELKSNEASIKYYILGSFASAIFLLGISAVYGVTATTSFSGVSEFLKTHPGLTIYHFLGTICIITALCFKAGCVPFHQWSPDVYEGAPTTVTAFMSVAPKTASVAALARLIFEAFKLHPDLWIAPLVFIAILTMAVGNILALRQNNMKRLLAYSSIAHAGYVMLAVIACSQEGMSSIVFYMIVYTFMNIGAFSVILALPGGEKIESYGGFSQINIFIAICMLVFMFSLAGIPPSGGFIAKFLVFKSTIQAGYVWVALAGIIFSILSAYYYLRVVVKMFFSPAQFNMKPAYPIQLNLKIAILVSVFFIVLTGVIPDIFNVSLF